MDCVNCLIRFANNKSSHRISLKAIALLRICEDRLAEVCSVLEIAFLHLKNIVLLRLSKLTELDWIYHICYFYINIL